MTIRRFLFPLSCVAGVLLGGLLFFGCEDDRSGKMAEGVVRIGQEQWTVEVALSDRRRRRGLSGRTELPPGRGMLFVFPDDKVRSFWMKGCLIPIDIVFIDADRRVVNTYEMAVEPDGQARARYSSHVPVRYALELPGGSLRRRGISVGDTVEFVRMPDLSSAEHDR